MNEEKPCQGIIIIDDTHELLTDEKRKELLDWFNERAKARLGKRVMVMSRSLEDPEVKYLMDRLKEYEMHRLKTTINIPARFIDGPRPLDRFIFTTPHVPELCVRKHHRLLEMEKEEVDKTKRSNRSPGKTLGKKKWWEKR